MKNTYYAWVGDEDNTTFDSDESNHASVTLASSTDAEGMRVTTDLSDNVSGTGAATVADAYPANRDKDSSVVVTVQLIALDTAAADAAAIAGADAVAKPGVEINVQLVREGGYNNPSEATLTTDDNGQVTFTLMGPGGDPEEGEDDRLDTLTFTGDVNGDATADTPDDETASVSVRWTDDAAVPTSSDSSAPAYAVIDNEGEVSVRASITVYDQYGNTIGKGSTVDIAIDGGTAETRTINSRGVASWRVSEIAKTAGQTVTVAFSNFVSDPTSTPTLDTAGPVIAVSLAVKNNATDDSNDVVVYADEDRFRYDSNDSDITEAESGILYSYDSNDVFIVDGENASMDDFEKAITTDGTTVQVVAYSSTASSIFSATTT